MAQLSGLFRIGRDAEVRFTGSGEPVSNLSLAFNYYDKNAEKNRASQWIEAALWGKRAESLAQYLTKGGLVYAVIQDPHMESFEGKNGTAHKLVGKIAEIELAGGRQDGQHTDQKSGNSASKPAQNSDRSASKPASQAPSSDRPFDDDDIPF